MLKVGLTGSIAVGKSFVCECFRKLGCHVLDADQTARDVVARGTAGLASIASYFGDEVLLADGALDRKKMGAIVFADVEKRRKLNSIVHPLIMAAQDEWILERELDDPDGIGIIDAALMIESGGYRRFDKLIVVWCKADIQLSRLMSRDGLSETEARMRIEAQMPQDDKMSYADYLIDTSDSFEATTRSVKNVYEQLRSFAN